MAGYFPAQKVSAAPSVAFNAVVTLEGLLFGLAAPVAILASALLSTSGVFLGLLITGTTFNISSFMGLIMLIGIVVKNGILLSRGGIGAGRGDGAGERRLRPITMTALAMVAGMIPLALGWGAGSQMLQPLAIALIGGILASMVLSLVVTPAVHYYLGTGGEGVGRSRQTCVDSSSTLMTVCRRDR